MIAAEPATQLRWDAPEACPAEAEVRRGVEALLGAPLESPRPRRLTVIASVQARSPGWSLRIFTVTPDGTHERALRHDLDCGLLTRAATVLIAIAIDPEVLGRLDPASLSLVEAPPPEPVVAARVEPVVEAAPVIAEVPVPVVVLPVQVRPRPEIVDKRRRPRGGVRLQGGIGWGDVPAVGGGVGLAGAVIWPRVRAEVDALVWPVRRARVVGADAGGDFLLWTIGGRVCPTIAPHRRIELPICGGFEGGQVRARGVRLENGSDAQTAWFALLLAPALVVAVTPSVALWVAPELAVPVTRPAFRVEGAVIHRAGAVAVRGMLGVEVRFPGIGAMDRRPVRNEGRGRP